MNQTTLESVIFVFCFPSARLVVALGLTMASSGNPTAAVAALLELTANIQTTDQFNFTRKQEEEINSKQIVGDTRHGSLNLHRITRRKEEGEK